MSTSTLTRQVVGEMQAIAAAKLEVEPIVGPVVACDSAAGIYEQALAKLDVDVIGAGLSSTDDLCATYRALRRMGARPAPRRMAMDSKGAKAREAMFPNAGRLRLGA